MEPFFPLHALVCERCFLVQLEEFETPEAIFSDYAYFSSYSTSWLEHCRQLRRDGQSSGSGSAERSQVVELASNDGYLLQYFVERGVPVLGRRAGRQRGRGRDRERHSDRGRASSGRETARRACRRERPRDLLIGNNVLAHVPDLNDFVAGMKVLLAAGRRDHDGVPAPRCG